MTNASTGDDQSEVLHLTPNQLFHSTRQTRVTVVGGRYVFTYHRYLPSLDMTYASTGDDLSDVVNLTPNQLFYSTRQTRVQQTVVGALLFTGP